MPITSIGLHTHTQAERGACHTCTCALARMCMCIRIREVGVGVWAGVDWGGGIAPLAAFLAVGGPTPLPVKGQREIGGERAVCW